MPARGNIASIAVPKSYDINEKTYLIVPLRVLSRSFYRINQTSKGTITPSPLGENYGIKNDGCR